MKANWDRAVDSVLLWEGGAAIRENEPGGAVNRGVSLAAYREDHPGADIPDLLAMTDEEAKDIYARRYAGPIAFDILPAGLDVAMLHGAVMFGVGGVKKMAQDARGDFAKLIVLMMQNKMHRQDGLKFMPGWSDRFVAVYDIAKSLA